MKKYVDKNVQPHIFKFKFEITKFGNKMFKFKLLLDFKYKTVGLRTTPIAIYVDKISLAFRRLNYNMPILVHTLRY